jgi:hypothetical protein
MPARRLARLETGTALRIADVAALLELYCVPGERANALLAVVRECHGPTWWTRGASGPALPGLEQATTAIDDFQLYLLPVLLRTADYTSKVLANAIPPKTAAEIDEFVAGQEARQARMARPGLRFIVDEYALGPLRNDDDTAREQRHHLLAMTARPGVTFQVIRRSVGMHAGLHGSFTILKFDQTDVIRTETLLSAMYHQTKSDVDMYRGMMDNIAQKALSPNETQEYLRAL